MKLEQEKKEIISSNISTEYQFSVGNLAMIFDILRNKLYSNKHLAIIREYCCNAYDANVEAGNKHIPISVQLPTSFDPTLKIRDNGPGISPDRVENIFVKYGSSTKGNSNELIGAMGLGSKSAMCLTDSFNVITVVDKVKRTYCVFIDESMVGKMSLLNEEATEEPNGTEIQIPVSVNDINIFANEAFKCLRFFDPLPKITGTSRTFQKIEKVIEGEGFFVSKTDCQASINIIMGGVSYSIPPTQQIENLSLIQSLIGNYYASLFITVNIGEVSVAANRETLHFDEKTLKLLSNKFLQIKESIVKNAEESVASAPSLQKALEKNLDLGRMASYFYTHPFIWKDVKIKSGQIEIDDLNYIRLNATSSGSRIYASNAILRSIRNTDIFNNTKFVIIPDDLVLPKDKYGHIEITTTVGKRLFNAVNASFLTELFLVKEKEFNLLKKNNKTITESINAVLWDDIKERFSFDEIKKTKLKENVLIFKENQRTLTRSSQEVFKDATDPLILKLNDSHFDEENRTLLINKKPISLASLKVVFPNKTIFAIKESAYLKLDAKSVIKKEIEKSYKFIENFFKDSKDIELDKMKNVAIASYLHNKHAINSIFQYIESSDDTSIKDILKELKVLKTSFKGNEHFSLFLMLYPDDKDVINKISYLRDITEFLDSTDVNTEFALKIKNIFHKYPMLKILAKNINYGGYLEDAEIKIIRDYVNTIYNSNKDLKKEV